MFHTMSFRRGVVGYIGTTTTQDTRAGLSRTLGWHEVLISFSVTLADLLPTGFEPGPFGLYTTSELYG